jgi:cardiolipin synthase
MKWVLRTYYARLLKKRIRIFEYKPSVLHAKTAIVDDWIEVGSTNLNSRSLFHDLEANYILQMTSTKNQLVQFISERFEKDCEEIFNTKKVVWWQQLLGRFALIFKHWI